MNYEKILLIDDDEDDQEIFLTALVHVTDKVTCTAFDSARDALQQLSSREISADLIFLDLNMPLMNGQQFLAEIKKEEDLKDIPVIILSTSSHAGIIKAIKESGAKDFITKPDKFEDLISILQTVLA